MNSTTKTIKVIISEIEHSMTDSGNSEIRFDFKSADMNWDEYPDELSVHVRPDNPLAKKWMDYFFQKKVLTVTISDEQHDSNTDH